MEPAVKKVTLRNKCVVLGAAAVGKTALVQAFHSDGNQFPKNYEMTIHAEMCIKPVNIPDSNTTVELYIFDLAGNDAFQEYLPKYCKQASTFIIVYDVTNADSFKSASKWLQLVKQLKTLRHIKGVLVATKCDQTHRRVVPTSAGEEYAKQNNLAYFETSPVTNKDVEAPFYFIAHAYNAYFEEYTKQVSKITSDLR